MIKSMNNKKRHIDLRSTRNDFLLVNKQSQYQVLNFGDTKHI